MEDCIIIGNSTFSRRIKKYIEWTSFGKVCAYAVESQYREDSTLDEIDVISLDEMKEVYQSEKISLIMGIGYSEMGEVRRHVFEQIKEWGYVFQNFVHPSAIVSPDLNIGEGNIILEGTIIESGVSIGNANLIFGGSQIGHDSTIGNYNTFASKVLLSSMNKVENHCYLGDCSVVSPKIELQNYALLGTMAHINKDLPANAVAVSEKSKIIESNKSKAYFNLFIP